VGQATCLQAGAGLEAKKFPIARLNRLRAMACCGIEKIWFDYERSPARKRQPDAQFLVKTADLLIREIPSSRMSASLPSDSHRSPNSVDCHIDRGPLRGDVTLPGAAGGVTAVDCEAGPAGRRRVVGR
jgi:hypothetical protein